MKSFLLFATFFLTSTFSLQAQNWLTDFEKAKTQATQEGKNIVLVFQGSDWCAPCIKLDKNIWSTEEFQTAAKDRFVMVQVDFPRKKKNRLSKEQRKHNSLLAEKYNPQGIFPTVAVLNQEGKLLGKTGYQKMAPKEYFDMLTKYSEAPVSEGK